MALPYELNAFTLINGVNATSVVFFFYFYGRFDGVMSKTYSDAQMDIIDVLALYRYNNNVRPAKADAFLIQNSQLQILRVHARVWQRQI